MYTKTNFRLAFKRVNKRRPSLQLARPYNKSLEIEKCYNEYQSFVYNFKWLLYKFERCRLQFAARLSYTPHNTEKFLKKHSLAKSLSFSVPFWGAIDTPKHALHRDLTNLKEDIEDTFERGF